MRSQTVIGARGDLQADVADLAVDRWFLAGRRRCRIWSTPEALYLEQEAEADALSQQAN